MRKGWFVIEGLQRGERSLQEQMRGLMPALATCAGRTVLDLGCAEGLIALEFAAAGAACVYACDCNPEAIAAARAEHKRRAPGLPVRFAEENLNAAVARGRMDDDLWPYDVVLALAILHKAHDTEAATRFAAEAARERLVLRLPGGSAGVIHGKHTRVECDTAAVLAGAGLRLESELAGPRGEIVQHWLRR